MAIFSAITSALGSLGTVAAGGGAAGAAGAATGIGGLAGLAGTAATLAGTALQYSGQKDAQEASKRAEQIRQAQMNVEAARQRRQIVRQAIIARSEALSSATSQGAAQGSGLAGGLGQIQGQSGGSAVATTQNQQLGNQIFGANQAIARGESRSALGSGISSLGGALVKNQDAIGRLGAYSIG